MDWIRWTMIVYWLVLFTQPAIAMERAIRDWQRDQPRQRYQRAAPQEQRSQPVYNEEGKQELHGATTRENCRKMAETFKRQGRNIRLVDTQRSKNPGAVLEWICIFQGGDAQTGYFDERRY